MELAVFYFFAFLALGSAVFILLTKNLMYAAFALFLSLVGVAGLFVLSGADFLAITQLMVYVGGILVLIIFGIMLTRTPDKTDDSQSANRILLPGRRQFWGLALSITFFLVLIATITQATFRLSGAPIKSRSTIKTLGVELMTSHLLPFEIAGILLLVALIGAAYLALNRNPS